MIDFVTVELNSSIGFDVKFDCFNHIYCLIATGFHVEFVVDRLLENFILIVLSFGKVRNSALTFCYRSIIEECNTEFLVL